MMSGLVRVLLFQGQVGFGDQTFGDVLLGFWGFGSPNTSLVKVLKTKVKKL